MIFGNFVRLLLLLPTVLRDRVTAAWHWRQQWKYALVVATISPIGYVLVLYAMKAAPLSHVAPASEFASQRQCMLTGAVLTRQTQHCPAAAASIRME